METSLDLSRHSALDRSMSNLPTDMTSSASSTALATSPRVTPPKKHVCNICPYKTSKIALLELHNQHHTPSEGNPYKCSLCDYWVCAKRLLKQHTRLHTGLPPPPSQPKPPKPANVNKPGPAKPLPLDAANAAAAAAAAAAASAASAGILNGLSDKELEQLLIPFTRKDSILAAENAIGCLPTMVPMQRSALSSCAPQIPAAPSSPPSTMMNSSNTTSIPRPPSMGKSVKAPRPLTASGHPISGDVERSRPFMCSACRKRSNWKWDIMKHIREKHADNPGGGEISVIELTTEEAKATLNDYLRQRNQRPVVSLPHISAHDNVSLSSSCSITNAASFTITPQDAATSGDVKPAAQLGKMFYCEQCPYSTPSCKDSIYHKQFHHFNPNLPFKCPHCNFWVGNRNKLAQHVKIHELTGIFGPHSSEGIADDRGEQEMKPLPPGITKEQAVFASLLDLSPAPSKPTPPNASSTPIKPEIGELAPTANRKENGVTSTPPTPHLPPSKIHRQQIADSNLR